MDESAREQLAERLTNMSLRHAMREMRSIDPKANMVTWRNSIWDEFHTIFLLPNEGVEVRLIEKSTVKESKRNREIGGVPSGVKSRNAEYEYVEARVAPLARPAFKRGGTGPSPMKHAEQGRAESVYQDNPYNEG